MIKSAATALTKLTPTILFCALALALSAFAALSISHPKRMDFAVYWYDTHGFFVQGLPLYGPHSAFAAPMLFRYPPVFALLFYPFTLVSFKTAGNLWAIIEAITLTATTYWFYLRLRLAIGLFEGLAALIICAPYFYLTFKDGNMQWLVTVLVVAAILLAADRPGLAGLALALGIAIKVWPVIFDPLFIVTKRRQLVAAASLWTVGLWFAPISAFGATRYFELLLEWFVQECSTNIGPRDIWYPSQSLRGILLRYFTEPKITLPYHSEFPDVHILTLPPPIVIGCWLIVALIAFCFALRSESRLFVVFSAFQPFCNWSSLVSLTPAALMAAHISSHNRRARSYLQMSLAISLIGYLASLTGANHTRLFEALGFHFLIAVAVGGCLLQKLNRRPISIVLGPPDWKRGVNPVVGLPEPSIKFAAEVD